MSLRQLCCIRLRVILLRDRIGYPLRCCVTRGSHSNPVPLLPFPHSAALDAITLPSPEVGPHPGDESPGGGGADALVISGGRAEASLPLGQRTASSSELLDQVTALPPPHTFGKLAGWLGGNKSKARRNTPQSGGLSASAALAPEAAPAPSSLISFPEVPQRGPPEDLSVTPAAAAAHQTWHSSSDSSSRVQVPSGPPSDTEAAPSSYALPDVGEGLARGAGRQEGRQNGHPR